MSVLLAAVASVLRAWHVAGSRVPWGESTEAEEQQIPPFSFSRSGDVIEYLLKSQWFVRCREMGDRAAQVRLKCREGRSLRYWEGPENWNEDIGRLRPSCPTDFWPWHLRGELWGWRQDGPERAGSSPA